MEYSLFQWGCCYQGRRQIVYLFKAGSSPVILANISCFARVPGGQDESKVHADFGSPGEQWLIAKISKNSHKFCRKTNRPIRAMGCKMLRTGKVQGHPRNYLRVPSTSLGSPSKESMIGRAIRMDPICFLSCVGSNYG